MAPLSGVLPLRSLVMLLLAMQSEALAPSRSVPKRLKVLCDSQQEPPRGREYYEGFLRSPLKDSEQLSVEPRDNLTPSLKFAGGAAAVMVLLVAGFFAANGGIPAVNGAELVDGTESGAITEPRGVTYQDTLVFAIGVVPFAWATVEFWRRIAVGLSFGTGKDSIVIDPDTDYSEGADEDQLKRFGGRRVLGTDAIITARLLFLAAGLMLGLTGFLAFQVITSG